MNIIKHLCSPEFLLRKTQLKGEIPSAKDAYTSFIRISWPSVMESVLIGLVGLVDTLMVSVLGTESVTAIGITGQPRMLFYAFFFALNVSVTAIVSRRKGQGDQKGANDCMLQALGISFFMGIILCGVAILLAEPLMTLVGPEDLDLTDSIRYFRIIMIGMFFTSMGMVINASHRGTGNTRIAMVTNITANLVNCALNYCMIAGNLGFPRLGVEGAAIATMVGNIVSCVISFTTVFKKEGYLKLCVAECFRFKSSIVKTIASIGSSAAVEQVFMRIGFLSYSIMVNKLGNAASATHTICMSILTLSFTVGDGLGVAASALVGQNLGKKRPDISLLYGKVGQRIGVIIASFLVLYFVFMGKTTVAAFITEGDINTDYIMMNGYAIMLICAVTSPAQVSQVIFNGCLRGAGDTKFVAVTSMITIMIIRPILTYVFCYACGLGIIGAWLSLIADQYSRLALSAVRFSGGKWAKIKI